MMRAHKVNRERGSSMIEFCFTVPVLLMVAGSTVDIARYMRYQQITTFVSQEAGSEIYQQCSDLTVYQKPTINSSGSLTPDPDRTVAAIVMCATRIQTAAQMVLNQSLGRSALSSSVFRYDIESADTTPDCGNAAKEVKRIALRGNMLENSTDGETVDWSQFGINYSPDDDCSGSLKNPIRIRSSKNSDSPTTSRPVEGDRSSTVNKETLTGSRVVSRSDGGIELKLPNGTTKELVNKSSMCNRGRVVAVEVGYDFEPIVKFLPGMIAKMDSDGNQREITIF